ncbi:hypothetical protein L226DRAFT_607055 [Lentinus tigrinus ALCF2SS1-7]|uniref:uncharacterized protein n=1 Tax=Lentinus tigrinus ALCF2SS1-7 TaxID=1328758 RepID=UPI001165D17D|nr:hypothetical protein L226DRAFT_607055 [Lentinus tigrinus ALCF2SS1-7]
MSTTMISIPDDLVVDVHDLAATILDAHARTEPYFPGGQLVEINRGITSPTTLPSHVFAPEWHAAQIGGKKRVAYILKKDSSASERISIDTFASPQGVKVSGGKELTRRELEDVFWRCKTFNNGYVLAYVAQRVFDSLPPTAKLRARTSAKHEVVCKPSDVTVAEIDIVAKEACLILDHEPRPDLGPSRVNLSQHFTGFDGIMPWVFLLIGEPKSEDLETDPRVVLDLVTSQLGGRGGGGEVFSLERAFDYHEKVLPNVANELEKYVLSGKIRLSEDALRARGDALVEVVMGRLGKIASGQDNFWPSLDNLILDESS